MIVRTWQGSTTELFAEAKSLVSVLEVSGSLGQSLFVRIVEIMTVTMLYNMVWYILYNEINIKKTM